MHFVSAIFSCSCLLSFHREIRQIVGRDTTKEYVCLRTREIFLCYKQLTSDRLTGHHQLLITHLVLQDELEERQILFLLQITAWEKDYKQFRAIGKQLSNKCYLLKIKKGKTSMLALGIHFF